MKNNLAVNLWFQSNGILLYQCVLCAGELDLCFVSSSTLVGCGKKVRKKHTQ
jgi:hypothetical protein